MELDLTHNHVGTKGGGALLGALRGHPTLTRLGLTHNLVSKSVLRAVAEACLGLGRIVAPFYRSSTLYQIQCHIRYLFSETAM